MMQELAKCRVLFVGLAPVVVFFCRNQSSRRRALLRGTVLVDEPGSEGVSDVGNRQTYYYDVSHQFTYSFLHLPTRMYYVEIFA